MDQDYPDKELIIYTDSDNPLKLDYSIDSNLVKLINNQGKKYKNLGAIYNDAIKYVSKDADIINIYDDDDIRPPYFLSEGVKGYKRATKQGKLAYKPKTSLTRSLTGLLFDENNFESSCFINSNELRKIGFAESNHPHFSSWYSKLYHENKMLIDNDNKPHYTYSWGEEVPSHHISGDADFNNHAKFSIDDGDGVISRLPKEKIQLYYDEIENFVNNKSLSEKYKNRIVEK